MCGRYTLRASLNRILEEFAIEAGESEWVPRYNIAPTQQVPIVVAAESGGRRLTAAKWGLIPSWADNPKIGNSLINARAETVAGKPAFRAAFKRGRCLVVADGFYEWKKEGDSKQPHFMRMRDERPFAFAGLTERWTKGERPLDTCTIITTGPNPLMAAIHDRMPVILPREAWPLWLDPLFQNKDELQALLQPYAADDLTAMPVSKLVNSARNEDPRCVERLNDETRMTTE